MTKNTIHEIGLRTKVPALYQAMTFVLFPISHSLCIQVMIGNSTRKVRILKITSKAIRLLLFSFINANGRRTPLSQFTVPLIINICLPPIELRQPVM
jgi:hypothetical protein